jgi:hypothetical protein
VFKIHFSLTDAVWNIFPDVKSTTHVMWRLLWGRLCTANRKWHGMRRSWPIWV